MGTGTGPMHNLQTPIGAEGDRLPMERGKAYYLCRAPLAPVL